MSDHKLIEEAHRLLHATPTASALDGLVHQIAASWCNSFGVNAPAAIERLSAAMLQRMVTAQSPQKILDLHYYLDMQAEAVIMLWFGNIQPFLLSADTLPLSLLRYSFLQANQSGEYADVFLVDTADFAEIGAAMAAHDMAPTPAMERRQMPRQEI